MFDDVLKHRSGRVIALGRALLVALFLLAIPVFCLGGLAGPPAQSMMTHLVDPHEQGRLQGALSSLRGLAGIFGPAMFANLFALFISDHAPVHHLPGAAFVLAALLLLAATLVAVRATRHAAPASVAEAALPAAQPVVGDMPVAEMPSPDPMEPTR